METEYKERARGGFVSYFNRTPPGIACPHFFMLHHSVGCGYSCSYCFLQNTLRGKTHPRTYTNHTKMLAEVFEWLNRDVFVIPKGNGETVLYVASVGFDDPTYKAASPRTLNAGELSDSFAAGDEWFEPVATLFDNSNPHGHKLVALTKSEWYPKKRYPNVAFSWSLTTHNEYDGEAPKNEARLTAMRKAMDSGNEVRVRIDPMMPGGAAAAADLAGRAVEMGVMRVTCGTLRAQGWLTKYAESRSPNPFVDFREQITKDGADNRLRLAPDVRLELYSAVKKVVDAHPAASFALCKETLLMWNMAFGWKEGDPELWKGASCNCTL